MKCIYEITACLDLLKSYEDSHVQRYSVSSSKVKLSWRNKAGMDQEII